MFEYLDVNGKKMAVKFGFNALRHFSRMTGVNISEMENLGTNMTFDIAVHLIYCGLQDGARVTKDKFNYEIEDLADDLDSDMTIIERCMTIFAEQMGRSKPQKKGKTKK
tara:strand:+ start:728 stop:1054 length:327 start_codon:yes stop_codon:yes gene_type:complete